MPQECPDHPKDAGYAALKQSAEVVPRKLAERLDNLRSLVFLLIGLQVAQLALPSSSFSLERIGYAVGVLFASSSLLRFRLIFGASTSLLGTVPLNNVLDWATLLPVCA